MPSSTNYYDVILSISYNRFIGTIDSIQANGATMRKDRRMSKTIQPFIYLGCIILLVGLACSFGSSTPPTPVPQGNDNLPSEPTSIPPTDEPTAEDNTGEIINSISEAKAAVIQIEAEGTFVDPEFGLQLNSAGRGTGFIIDPSGLAVTNNHVVTGAALIKVRLPGDNSWRNARLVAVSECSDLAVIDIEGDGYPYFEWFSGPIEAGQELYVAGFPLGDPEFTVTRGVVSKARADGESTWASVDSVFEYDANTLPGNSGGPVITPDGKVLGIHYAWIESTRQNFGISRDVAASTVNRLKNGENVDTIGINGMAVSTEDGSLTGIWVSSVQSGSAADNAGVRPGDVVYQMENLVLATDGTMADYCDILRTHDAADTLNLTVIRWDSGEVMEGQLNGRKLAFTGYFGDGSSTSTQDGESSAGESGDSSGLPDGVEQIGSGYYDFSAVYPGDVAYVSDFDWDDLSDWFYFLTNGEDNDFTAEVVPGVLHVTLQAQTPGSTW
jgi:serine protease Do